jgi:2-methylcitrate dehydratase PrpD
VKRLASTLFAVVLFLTLGSTSTWAQRTGSVQATATVVDSRAAMSGLTAAQNLASSWSAAPSRTADLDTGFAQVSLRSRSVAREEGRPESELEIRVDYLRN